MTSKEYLSQAYHLDQRINSKIEQISSLNELATKCTSTITGMPHSPNKGKSQMADTIAKIIDLERFFFTVSYPYSSCFAGPV